MANVSIVTQYGSHLLLQRRGRLAIVERRDDGRIYPVHEEESEGFPDTSEGMLEAVGHDGWADPETVRDHFEEITTKGETLAQKMR
jgi:hypothetical protein